MIDKHLTLTHGSTVDVAGPDYHEAEHYHCITGSHNIFLLINDILDHCIVVLV